MGKGPPQAVAPALSFLWDQASQGLRPLPPAPGPCQAHLPSSPRPFHGALSYASSLFPVGGRPLALAWPGPSNLQSRALGVSGSPFGVAGTGQHPLPSVCLPTASTLPLLILLVPPRCFPASKAFSDATALRASSFSAASRAHVVPSGGELTLALCSMALLQNIPSGCLSGGLPGDAPRGTWRNQRGVMGLPIFRAPPTHSAAEG